MAEHALLGHLFVFGAGHAVVGIRIDADAATRGEEADDLDILGGHELHQVLHDDVDAVLVEVAVIAKREEVELQALRLDHALRWDIHNLDFGKVGLPRDGTERRELGAVELHPVVVALVLVLKRLQHLRRIAVQVLGLAA